MNGRFGARFLFCRQRRARKANAGLTAIVVLALLAAIGYAALAAISVYQGLERGRTELVDAQSALASAPHSPNGATLKAAAAQLRQAEADFAGAEHRSRQDPALRLAGALPWSGSQVEASAHLAAIGADLSRAGEAATTVAQQLDGLRRQYAGRPLTADDLQALLQQAQVIADSYKASIAQIGDRLKAAHAERAQVTTTGLVPPLQHAYDEVDRALREADTEFLRYQDVRGVLSDLLGVPLSG